MRCLSFCVSAFGLYLVFIALIFRWEQGKSSGKTAWQWQCVNDTMQTRELPHFLFPSHVTGLITGEKPPRNRGLFSCLRFLRMSRKNARKREHKKGVLRSFSLKSFWKGIIGNIPPPCSWWRSGTGEGVILPLSSNFFHIKKNCCGIFETIKRWKQSHFVHIKKEMLSGDFGGPKKIWTWWHLLHLKKERPTQ